MATPDISNLHYKIAKESEAPVILDLWKRSANWLLDKGIRQWRPENFQLEQVLAFMRDGSDVYLAELDGIVAGTFVLTWADPFIWKELDSPDAGYIHRFAVNREWRGCGIGLQLLREAERQIKRKGKTRVRLDCMAENPRLNRYYTEAGFEYVRRLDAEGWSANLYEKR